MIEPLLCLLSVALTSYGVIELVRVRRDEQRYVLSRIPAQRTSEVTR